MTEDTERGWFEGVDPEDLDGARAAIEDGTATAPADWPTRAVETGFAADAGEYYDRLHAATTAAATAAVADRERADDRQLVHAVRAVDDLDSGANELAERVEEWAGSRGVGEGSGLERARSVLTALDDGARGDSASGPDDGDSGPEPVEDDGGEDPSEPAEDSADEAADRRLRALAARAVGLAEEADALRAHVERTAPAVAPNLSAMAGPVLAARLIALAGDLESLARMPSGTVQVLGAEEALFAHLRGAAPSPKHGVIYTHEYVRGTHPEHRGSAARALAGKLTIAARVDHYAGDRRPELDRELDERIARIRARTGDTVEGVTAPGAPGGSGDTGGSGDAGDGDGRKRDGEGGGDDG